MALEEAAAWLDGDLVLPIGGKKYRVPEFSVELGIRVEVILNASRGKATDRQKQILTDEEERETYRDVLGPAYDQMVKDGVTWPRMRHAAFTAMFHFNVSPEFAEQHWNRGVTEGKAPAGSSRPATRRTTAAASTTRKPASGSGTRSRARS
jgi:hypothetical protein